MCQLRIIHFNCRHSKRLLMGNACDQAQYHNRGQRMPSYCPVAQREHINVSGDCRVDSLIIACQVLPYIDGSQRRVLELCDVHAREVNAQSLKLTSSILIALSQLSGGGTFRAQPYPEGNFPAWVDGSPNHYPDQTTMMNAAWYRVVQAHKVLSAAFYLAQVHIISGFHYHPDRDQLIARQDIAEAIATVILGPFNQWVVDVAPKLTEMAEAMERLSADVLGEALDEVHPDTASGAESEGNARFVSHGHAATAEQPSQSTLNNIDEMVEMFARQHTAN